MNENENLLTLAEAAKIAPGRPSANCMWRWCRRGVLSRTGQRITLRHVRLGGRVFTSERWIQEFGSRLADADAAYFAEREEHADDCAVAVAVRPSRSAKHSAVGSASFDDIEAELEAEGL